MMNNMILRKTLQQAIADVNKKPKTFMQKVKKSMVYMFNVPVGDTVDIFNGKLPVEGMSLDTLYKVSKVLHELYQHQEEVSFDLDKLDVVNYFTETQIRQFSLKIQDEEPVGDIVFDKFLELNPDQYLVVASIDEIIRWRDSRRIKYNEKTQRKMTIRESNGLEIKSVTLNAKARGKIHELMENDEFISNTLTLNVNPDYHPTPYITKDGKLVIPEESEIDMSDGFHRYLEMTSVKDKNNTWKYRSAFYITVFNEEKSNQFIWQEDHKNHLAKEQRDTMSKIDEVNYLLERLNTSSDFHLKGSLTDEKLFVMNKVIHSLFEDKENKLDRKTGIKLYKTIETNMNSLIEEKDLYDKEITKQEWFIYLSILNFSIKNELKFIDIINKIDIETLASETIFRNEPKDKQYTQIGSILKEVMKNV